MRIGLRKADGVGMRSWRGRQHVLLAALASIVLLVTRADAAEEPSGCDAFKWPLAKEAALLQATGKPVLAPSGAAAPFGKAFTLALTRLPDVHLPTPPERAPKMDPSMAGFVRFDAPMTAGPYEMTISQGAWIDLVQDGQTLKPSAFSGARDCPGVRKSIRFTLMPKPFTVQISGTKSDAIDILVEPLP